MMAALAPAALAAVRTLSLDSERVHAIRISRDEPTTCVFPGPLTALEGAGVGLKPDDGASVILSYRPGAEFFSLRALEVGATAALNVVYRGRVYVLTFTDGEAPDRAIRFLEREAGESDSRGSDPGFLRSLLERIVSRGRTAGDGTLSFRKLTGLAGGVTRYPGFTVIVEDVFRFDAEDALVLRLRLENPGKSEVRYARRHLAVRIGRRTLPAALTDASGSIPPQSAAAAHLVVTGVGQGDGRGFDRSEPVSVIVPPVP